MRLPGLRLLSWALPQARETNWRLGSGSVADFLVVPGAWPVSLELAGGAIELHPCGHMPAIFVDGCQPENHRPGEPVNALEPDWSRKENVARGQRVGSKTGGDPRRIEHP